MIIRDLSKKIDLLVGTTDKYSAQVDEFSQFVQQTMSLLAATPEPSDKKNINIPGHDISTKELTINDLCMLHRALLFDAPAGVHVGSLRHNDIWIGGTSASTASFVPPKPELVVGLLEQLLSKWQDGFDQLLQTSDPEKISAIVKFHHGFLNIHPFMDGNGRIARFLLTQHAREFLNQKHRIIIEDRRPYFEALSKADHGDYSALEAHITQAIFGVEFIGGSPCQMSGQRCPGCKEGVMDVDGSGTGVECSSCGLTIPAVMP
jgi:fido (protein-threonine AMPylation protein)